MISEKVDINVEMENALKKMKKNEFLQNKETGEWQLN